MKARRLRLGMVGGGEGAFIGGVHRIAARLDDEFELVAGALSSDPGRAAASAEALRIAPERSYGDFRTMATREAAQPDGIDVVAIVTPNHLHHAAARAFLDAGIDVICDKPLARTLGEGEDLVDAVRASGRSFIVTYNYTGYPMVRQAREMIRAGVLGVIRVVQVEYLQEWLTAPIEATGQKQAAWRTDPERSGPVGALGDIGTHAFNLAEFVTGLKCEAVAAELTAFVAGRRLDDNASVQLRFAGGARGSLWCSQVAPGHENDLRLRVFGEAGAIEWVQEHPNQLRHAPFGKAPRVISRGGAETGVAAAQATRIPAGHPEAFLEAFGQIYREAAEHIRSRRGGVDPPLQCALLPTIQDGLRGLQFVTACVKSNAAGSRVTPIET
jgi:predicted dehydrogenase